MSCAHSGFSLPGGMSGKQPLVLSSHPSVSLRRNSPRPLQPWIKVGGIIHPALNLVAERLPSHDLMAFIRSP